jgi:hypothetical protein
MDTIDTSILKQHITTDKENTIIQVNLGTLHAGQLMRDGTLF